MRSIVVAMEPDIEVTRHHMSMSLPFGAIGFTNHRWDTNNVSAYDMFDAVKPELVICSEKEYEKNSGLREYTDRENINCLVRYEAAGDIYKDNVITYTRYENNELKQCLPSCADVINFKDMGLRAVKRERAVVIMCKNYINSDMALLTTKFEEESHLDIEVGNTLYNITKQYDIKVFRGHNTLTAFSLGDVPDRVLCEEINRADVGWSTVTKEDVCVTTDVMNMLHCGIPVNIDPFISEQYRNLFNQVFNQAPNSMRYEKSDLRGLQYTNFDRAIQISSIFGLGVEQELIDESVEY